MIVVLGLYRGGSSTVAGILHHLGACLGHELKVVPTTAIEGPGYCTFEDWPLRRTFLRCYTEPELEPRLGFYRRVDALRQYLHRRETRQDVADGVRSGRTVRAVPRAGCSCQPLAVKFPGLCYMGPEILKAWGTRHRLTFVSVERDRDTVAQSLTRWYPDHAWELTDRLIATRARFLDKQPHIVVPYEALVAQPEDRVRRLAELVPGLNPSEAQITRAAAFVSRPVLQGVQP